MHVCVRQKELKAKTRNARFFHQRAVIIVDELDVSENINFRAVFGVMMAKCHLVFFSYQL